MRLSARWLLLGVCAGAACRGGRRPASPAPQVSASTPIVSPPSPRMPLGIEPALPPEVAFKAGFLPLASTGVSRFRIRHPTYDGRGVLIGILDSGLDPGVDGLLVTSTGGPKVLDVRDFSGEGTVTLRPVTPSPDGTVRVGHRTLTGAGRIARITTATTWYAGELRELRFGKLPAADLNGNGTNTDVFPVIVVKATDGWVSVIDTNLDGSFEDETPLHDYRQGRETVALGSKPLTVAANLDELHGQPSLTFVFDNSSHGTHVAGIAAGRTLFGVPGFDGVAPGAQVIGLKISNNARGGVTVTGSIQRAMAYAARFAEARGLPLVLNLSFGVGNESEGRAAIDSLINAFLITHPSVVFAISVGNDGPGLSTLGFPGSTDLAMSAGASYPGAFARMPFDGTPVPDVVGWWSARGGEVAKPDLITPGVAFSAVPRFDAGDEVKGGTSMAAPHAAGLAARLLSAMQQEGRSVNAAEIIQALRISGARFRGATPLDQGGGEPQIETAYRWLNAGHQGSSYIVRTERGASAAFRRDSFAGPSDTMDVFHVRHVGGARAAQFVLRSSVSWISVPSVVPAGAVETEIPVRYTTGSLRLPGWYLGVVTAWNPSDTLAGPVFSLLSTVVIPYDLGKRPLDDSERVIGPARVQRYFLRVPDASATLHITVTLPDSLSQSATARLYEPTGRPFRDAEETSIGQRDPGTARFLVRGEDLVPGVYELDVFAPPLSGATASVRAELAPLTLGETGGWVEASNRGAATVIGRVAVGLLGAAREYSMTGAASAPDTITVTVPDWAATAIIEVTVPLAQWNDLTSFGVTEFDSTGQLVGQSPLNYASGRQRLTLPPRLRKRPLTIELLPAFARGDAGHPWHAAVRVQFLLPREQQLTDGMAMAVVPGGRMSLGRVMLPNLAVPPEFAPLVEVRARPSDTPETPAVRRVMVAGR